MIAVAQWLSIWVFSMEVLGSNTGNYFANFFHAPLLTYSDCSIRVFQLSTMRYTVVWFLPYNSTAVTAIFL